MLEIEMETGLVRLSGSFDATDEEAARLALAEVTESTIVDLDGLEYLSSAGMGVLFAVQVRLMKHQKKLTLVNPQPFVCKVFKLANVGSFFGIE